MLERFTAPARRTVETAFLQAVGLGHEFVGTEHLLLSLLARADLPAGDLLRDHGLDLETATAAVRTLLAEPGLDAEALAGIGIDLDAVTAQVEAAFGPGALERAGGATAVVRRPRLTGRARQVLALAVRAAREDRSRAINDGHLLLGLLREPGGLARRVLLDHGFDLAELERRAQELARG